MAQNYRYRVTHPVHGEVEVEGTERLYAVSAAAKHWGVPWTHIARECWCERLGPVEHKVVRHEAAEQKTEKKTRKGKKK